VGGCEARAALGLAPGAIAEQAHAYTSARAFCATLSPLVPAFFNLGDYHDAAHAERVALIDCLDWEHPREVSHGEMDRLARAVARGLVRHGLKRGDAVAILSANRTEFLAAYFGIMRAAMVAVPVNYKFPRETIEFVLADSATKLAFCDRERRRLLPGAMPAVEFGGEWASFLNPGAFETVVPDPGEAAMVLYTSGSTGRPKGVSLSHQGQLWAVESRLRAGASFLAERLIIAAPLFHMNALGTSKFIFAAQASMVLLPQFDAQRYIASINLFGVTWLTSVPTMLAMVVREKDALSRTDLSRVHYVRMGSAPASTKLIEDIRRLFPNAVVSNAYGTTEAGPVVFGPHPDGRPKDDLALGWPMPGVDVKLVGSDGREADEGVLWQRTPANMRGYLNLPEKTREVLTRDGWYISGDVFRRDANGAYSFVGRDDDMFNCGGENIYPGEIEQMLEKHADILQACVVPVPDEIKGEKPVAFVVLRGESQLTEDDVKQYALSHAPAYQHPRRVNFLNELPLASTNKVDRKSLRALALEQGLQPTQASSSDSAMVYSTGFIAKDSI
jgi:long-chain acyl-CoA synthetase